MARSIALIDDHQLFASGLAALLAPLGQVRTFGDVELALAALSKEPADLVLLDYYVPGTNAADTIETLRTRCRCLRVLVLSASLSPSDREASLRAGALGFVTKHTDPDVLLEMCETVLATDTGISPEPATVPSAEALGLTPRQLDVVVMLGHGCSNREIAELLSISPETVKSHLKAIYERLGASNRTEAIAVARLNGLL